MCAPISVSNHSTTPQVMTSMLTPETVDPRNLRLSEEHPHWTRNDRQIQPKWFPTLLKLPTEETATWHDCAFHELPTTHNACQVNATTRHNHRHCSAVNSAVRWADVVKSANPEKSKTQHLVRSPKTTESLKLNADGSPQRKETASEKRRTHPWSSNTPRHRNGKRKHKQTHRNKTSKGQKKTQGAVALLVDQYPQQEQEQAQVLSEEAFSGLLLLNATPASGQNATYLTLCVSQMRTGEVIATNEVIGHGTFGVVHGACAPNAHLVVKRYTLPEDEWLSDGVPPSFLQELLAAVRVTNMTHVMRVCSWKAEPSTRLLQMSSPRLGCTAWDLFGCPTRREWHSRVRAWEYAVVQIVCGMTQLHSQNLLHLDLRPNNILVSGNPSDPVSSSTTFVINDLGTCRYFTDFGRHATYPYSADCTNINTLAWKTPEHYASEIHRSKKKSIAPWRLGPQERVGVHTDMWALGVTLLWMLVCHATADDWQLNPFAKTLGGVCLETLMDDLTSTDDKRVHAALCSIDGRWDEFLPGEMGSDGKGLLSRLLAADPTLRPSSMAEVWLDPFISRLRRILYPPRDQGGAAGFALTDDLVRRWSPACSSYLAPTPHRELDPDHGDDPNSDPCHPSSSDSIVQSSEPPTSISGAEVNPQGASASTPSGVLFLAAMKLVSEETPQPSNQTVSRIALDTLLVVGLAMELPLGVILAAHRLADHALDRDVESSVNDILVDQKTETGDCKPNSYVEFLTTSMELKTRPSSRFVDLLIAALLLAVKSRGGSLSVFRTNQLRRNRIVPTINEVESVLANVEKSYASDVAALTSCRNPNSTAAGTSSTVRLAHLELVVNLLGRRTAAGIREFEFILINHDLASLLTHTAVDCINTGHKRGHGASNSSTDNMNIYNPLSDGSSTREQLQDAAMVALGWTYANIYAGKLESVNLNHPLGDTSPPPDKQLKLYLDIGTDLFLSAVKVAVPLSQRQSRGGSTRNPNFMIGGMI